VPNQFPDLAVDSRLRRQHQKQNAGLKTVKSFEKNEPFCARGSILQLRARTATPQNARGRAGKIRADFPSETAKNIPERPRPLAQKHVRVRSDVAEHSLAWQKKTRSLEKIAPSFGTNGPKTVKTRFCAQHDELPPGHAGILLFQSAFIGVHLWPNWSAFVRGKVAIIRVT